MKKYILVLMFMFFLSAKSFASIDVAVDNQYPAVGEKFILTLESDKNISDMPDFQNLGKDFKVVSTSVSHQSYIVNGKAEHSTKWHIGLVPMKTGNITIPEIRIANEVSKPLTISVQAQSQTKNVQQTEKANPNSQKYTLTAQILEPKQDPYVQEQITYAVFLKDDGTIEDGHITFEEAGDFIIKPLSKPKIRQLSNGRREIMYLYAVFAQKSGIITLPIPHFEGVSYSKPDFDRVFEGGFFQIKIPSIFGFQTPVYLDSEKQEINILPADENYKGDWWLPAQNISVSSEILGTQRRFVEAMPIVREVTLSATGLAEEQLPDLILGENPDFKQYVEEQSIETKVVDTQIVSTKKIEITYIPQKAGKLILPAIEIDFFDLKTKTMQKAVSEAINIEVSPALKKEVQSLEKTDKENKIYTLFYFWPILAFLAGLMVSWLVFKKKDVNTQKETMPTIKTVLQAAKESDLKVLRDELILFAKKHFKNKEIKNLKDVADLSRDMDFKKQIELLSKALYADQKDIDFNKKEFVKICKKALTSDKAHKKEKEPLPSLYK